MQGLGDFFCIMERDFLGLSDEEDLHGDGRWETREIIVLGEVPINMFDGGPVDRKSSEGGVMPIPYMLFLAWHDLNAELTIGETDERKNTGFMNNRLRALGVRETMRDRYMTVPFGVDTCHLTAEELPVNGGVIPLIDSNIIMDHLMEDRVLNEGFWEVNADVYAKDKILVSVLAEETVFAAGEGEFAEEAFGVREADGDGRELPAEKAGIEVVKTGLYVRDSGGQLN